MKKHPYFQAEKGLGALLGASNSDLLKALNQPKKARIEDRIASLGIPKEQLTQDVTIATSALLEKIDHLTHELQTTKESLAEMERLVDVDVLAPIPNRRAFMRRLQWAIAMHERHGHPSAILYFDLNDFKEINDDYGHAAGDLAIRHVSDILSDSLRDSDFLARIGGDEFALIMYYATEEQAIARGKKIAERIKNSSFMFNGTPLTITTAIGASPIRKGDNPESALSNADTSMYIDKKKIKAKRMDVRT